MSNKKITKVEDVNKNLFDESKREAWVYGLKAVEEAELLSRDNLNKDILTVETFEMPEWTSLCPRSGFPDSWKKVVVYVPNEKVIDEVSFKLYWNKFRNFRGWHETSTNEFMDDIFPLIEPKYLMVFWSFGIRGNVKTIPVAEKWDENISEEEKEMIKLFIQPYLKWAFNKVKDKINNEF